MADLFGDDPPARRKRSRARPDPNPDQLVFNFPDEVPATFTPPSRELVIYCSWKLAQRATDMGDLRAAEGFLDKTAKLMGHYAPTQHQVSRDPLEQLMDEIADQNAEGGLHDLTTH